MGLSGRHFGVAIRMAANFHIASTPRVSQPSLTLPFCRPVLRQPTIRVIVGDGRDAKDSRRPRLPSPLGHLSCFCIDSSERVKAIVLSPVSMFRASLERGSLAGPDKAMRSNTDPDQPSLSLSRPPIASVGSRFTGRVRLAIAVSTVVATDAERHLVSRE